MASKGVSAYAAVHARVRAMRASLISPEQWQRLDAAPDFGALLSTLRETVYGAYLDQVNEAFLTPRRAVYQIKMHLAQACTAVIRMVSDQVRPLMTQLYRLHEVDNLKAVLRGLMARDPWDRVRYVLFPMNGRTVVPVQEIVEAGTISDAVNLLRGTPYYATLSHAMERYTAEQSLFPLEVALDLAYWRELWQDVQRLSGREREQALRLVGTMLDINNLMWAIRYRVHYQLSEEEIINYTLPFGYRVHDHDIRTIAAGGSIAPLLLRIYPDIGDVSEYLSTPGFLSHLEIRLQHRLVAQCNAAFVGYPFHVGIPAAYLLLNELEIQDLTVLIEAKAMQAAPETFLPYLVMREGSQARLEHKMG
ncbi:MAG: V-type ATPase subunit [Anaerolineae bacterium]|nr:V-type ATPase subunit [Anaerolineae bacterium]